MKRSPLLERLQGQHIHLSVAAHLARTQLVKDALEHYDSQHLLEMVDVIARALAKVAPLHVNELLHGEPRELTALELEGAKILEAGHRLQTRDGRMFASVSIKRSDLRQAIAILRLTGVPEIAPPATQELAPPARPPKATLGEQRARLGELERLLTSPLLPTEVHRAERLSIAIARDAEHGNIGNLSMKLLSALHASRDMGYLDDDGRLALARLRLALEGET